MSEDDDGPADGGPLDLLGKYFDCQSTEDRIQWQSEVRDLLAHMKLMGRPEDKAVTKGKGN